MATAALDPSIARYEARLDRSDPARVAAFERFVELGGFPGPHDESWRQTPTKGITGTKWSAGSREQLTEEALAETPHISTLQLPGLPAGKGHQGGSAEQSLIKSPNAFALLNQAFHADQTILQVAPNTDGASPSWVVYRTVPLNEPVEGHTRLVIEVGDGARCSILEVHATTSEINPSFTTHVTEIRVGDGAQVEHTVWQQLGAQAQHVAITQAELGRDSRITFNGFTDGGAMVRNEVRARFTAPGGHADMNGLYLGSGVSVIDYHTQVDHATTDSSSHQLYKGVLADRARGVFEGHVMIREGSQRTNATQSNRNLLLTDGAGVHTKPLLEIYNDDVQCAHGAAIGQLDDAALFYLRQRGIPFAAARRMLAESFVADVVDRVQNDLVREWLKPRVLAALPLGDSA